MVYSRDAKSARVRAHLDHPVIDGDGHWLGPDFFQGTVVEQAVGQLVWERE